MSEGLHTNDAIDSEPAPLLKGANCFVDGMVEDGRR
jgi:hypothetical protein